MISDDYPLDFGVLSQTNPYRLLDSPASPGLQIVSANSCNMPLAAAKIWEVTIGNWFRWEILPNSTTNIHHHNCFPRNLRGSLAHRSGHAHRSHAESMGAADFLVIFQQTSYLVLGWPMVPENQKKNMANGPMWDSCGPNDVKIVTACDGHAGSFPRLSLRPRTLRHMARLSMTITLGSRRFKWKWKMFRKKTEFPMKMQVWSPFLVASLGVCFNSHPRALNFAQLYVTSTALPFNSRYQNIAFLDPQTPSTTSDHHTLLGSWRYTTTLSTKSNTAYNPWVSAPNISGHESNPLWHQ